MARLAVRPGDVTFAHIQAHVDEIVTVEDDAIVDAVGWVFDRARLVAEPSGAASIAAALARGTTSWSRTGAIAARDGSGHVVALISGGNVDTAAFCQYITSARHA